MLFLVQLHYFGTGISLCIVLIFCWFYGLFQCCEINHRPVLHGEKAFRGGYVCVRRGAVHEGRLAFDKRVINGVIAICKSSTS